MIQIFDKFMTRLRFRLNICYLPYRRCSKHRRNLSTIPVHLLKIWAFPLLKMTTKHKKKHRSKRNNESASTAFEYIWNHHHCNNSFDLRKKIIPKINISCASFFRRQYKNVVPRPQYILLTCDNNSLEMTWSLTIS